MKELVPNFLALIFLSLITFSTSAAENGVIRGKVVEEIGALPVPFAGVVVYDSNTDQSLFTMQTDENGYFKFINLKTGTYKIKVTFVGFTNLFVNDIIITDKDFDKNLGNLKMSSESSSLAEVVISAPKPLVEFGADVITYNVGSSVLAEGSTATDVLKNVPMVEVDIDGNATITGKRSTRVFIDGKPSDYMTSNIADLLNVLPSDAIEKIEVMTNPPSRYSGDGEGILNIVMKKGFKVGFNGNIGVTAGLQGNANTNANASYRGKNFNINGSGAFRQNIGKSNSESYRTNLFPDTTFYYNQFNHNRSENDGGNFRLGFDWDITPKQNLRLSTNYNLNHNDSQSGSDLYYLNEEHEQKRQRNQQNLGDGNSNNFVFNADYNLKTDTIGGRLSIGLTVNRNSNSSLRSYHTIYPFPIKNTLKPSLQQNENDIGNRGLNFNLDYDKPVFNKRDQLEFGIAYNYRKNDNDLQVQNLNFQTQEYVNNKKLSNKFFYNENILSGYASYNYRKNGWGLKTGLRAELTDVNFDLSTGDSYNVDPYLSLFPNISINHFFKKRYNFGATYSIRINRPRENTLNPQINNADTLNISYGNPGLLPAYTHQMDFSFGAFGQKWSFTPRVSYSKSSGVIERYRIVNSNGVSESTFDNVGTNHSLALMLIGNFRPTRKISTNGNFSIIQSKYSSKLNSALNRDGLSVRASMGFSMQLPYKTAFESNINYANNINAQGRNKGSINSSFGARKTFFKNRLTTRVSTNDPFGRKNNNSFNQGNNFISESHSINNSSNVTLSLNYRFTKVKMNKVAIPPAPKK
ncbi:MAG: outer membrane beta-barrel protein [Bacteroidota bacterium]